MSKIARVELNEREIKYLIGLVQAVSRFAEESELPFLDARKATVELEAKLQKALRKVDDFFLGARK